MKIVVASNGEKVSSHFGHCGQFLVFNIVNNAVVSREVLPYPGHKPGLLPRYLYDAGTNVIIAGGMGGSAVSMFNERGIEVVIGNTGDACEVVSKYLKGELKSVGSECTSHSFESDSCKE